jgi:LysM repeat protein
MIPRRHFLRWTAAALGSACLPRLWADEPGTYRVRRGDTLSGIARRFGVTVDALRTANSLRGDRILVGQVLVIPGLHSELFHEVRAGESLSVIARRYSITVASLREANGLRDDRIYAGQRLRIPVPHTGPVEPSPFLAPVVAATSGLDIDRSRWRHIVAHHSAVNRGNAAMYDRFHREQRRMINGLAYHFVIGNGTDSGDGVIEIGNRWIGQLDGGHVRNHAVNTSGIGICLVGNFEETRPTQRQLDSLIELIEFLRRECAAVSCRFAVHREIDRGHTVCPGRFFPTTALHRRFN